MNNEQLLPFTIIALPDTQAYTLSYPHLFTCQTEWIKENKDKENIVFVVHEGDISCFNKEVEWQRANESMSILDGGRSRWGESYRKSLLSPSTREFAKN